jgi:hypothetical protein
LCAATTFYAWIKWYWGWKWGWRSNCSYVATDVRKERKERKERNEIINLNKNNIIKCVIIVSNKYILSINELFI